VGRARQRLHFEDKEVLLATHLLLGCPPGETMNASSGGAAPLWSGCTIELYHQSQFQSSNACKFNVLFNWWAL
jgi:hypothetical protein